ncbi:MAG: 50S ribosomal protein L24 [Candidatus Aenigmarchaeota archaeon]|nr:50S ribosomal protein L24 [Candidatus Aenigmarchaeota archaeon]NIP41016.1 50S ribosomal protein L24 [Candidatus Aenigmarchaeota archaeon]NIQ17418.1 50S ribosomal protein L24 [Candidatus Aenigmarchaeota archaeon]NIS73612.1 50S ribosomal protein L24 [Candidatus Aenigmarchaeota archaeon]
MKKEWSNKWVSSKQPRKQRKFRHRAPLHVRQKFVSAHLSEILRRRFGKRSLPLRKGDEVRVMRGKDNGFKGKVERIDLKRSKVFIEGLNVKKVDGSEVLKAVEPSNLLIVEPKMEDKRRQATIERARKAGRKEEKVEKEKKETTGIKERLKIRKGAKK